MKTQGGVTNVALNSESSSDAEDLEPLRCLDCDISFTNKHYLNDHLFHHIKQPQVTLTRLEVPPLKIALKGRKTKSFEVICSPSSAKSPNQPRDSDNNLADSEEEKNDGHEEETEQEEPFSEEDVNVNFSPSFAEVNVAEGSPTNSDSSISGAKVDEIGGDGSECESIPGAEPTPPPEPSSEYPKIRIKTTGLLKDSLTITEITDDNPEGDELGGEGKKDSWRTSMEDPLKLPGNDDILSIFNNNERAKDFGFTTSDSEFIPMDRPGDRNTNAVQLYSNPNQNALGNLAGLPMEALAQQVSRLQPSGNGMHQQNVLINIQQFAQPPHPPPPYHPPNLFHHPPQPMYPQPYPTYQPPPNPMHYPPGGYPHQYMPPPPPQAQMPQLGQSQMIQPPMVQQSMGQPQMGQPPSTQPQGMQNQPFRPLGPRQPAPPRPMQPQRMPTAPRQPMNNQRQPMPRQRPPMMRPRGAGITAVRSVRPRMPVQNGVRQPMMKRSPEQIQALQAKKKRLDVLTPDKDDEDCQVICMQPKNTDGGLPQISSVQGGTSEPSESSVMHLSDSITLSVRNPQPRPQSPKKSDAKAVANILATRGITVTATPKPKEKGDSPKNSSVTQLNLNAAVSIIPSAKNAPKATNSSQESHLPTVDLTDDTSPVSQQAKTGNSPQQQPQRRGLPFKCDLCPAQYPNAVGLSKHRQNYHKTNNGMCEIGVPLINLKQPGIFQKLSSMGIFNYIPLPSSGPDGMFALPIINGRSPGNVAALGVTSMLTLGPVRNIPRPQNPVNGTQNPSKPMNNNQNK